MKKTFLILSAVLWVFSANTNAIAHSDGRATTIIMPGFYLNGFQVDNGLTLNLVTRRYGGGQRHHYNRGHHYRGHRFGGQHRNHRFGQRGFGQGGFRFNFYRPYYQPFGTYYQRPHRHYNSYRDHWNSGRNHHRGHDRGHRNRRHSHNNH